MRMRLLALFFAFATAVPATAQDANIEKIVTMVTAAEPQTQLMSMVLTVQALQNGVEAHILLCGPAADMALRDAPAGVTEGQPPVGISPQGMMQVAQGYGNTIVEVCALYLPGRGITPDDLLDGIGVASPNAMAAILTARDVRVLSF